MEKHLPLHYDLALRDPFNKDQGPFWNSIVIIDFLGSGTPAGIQHQLLSLGVSWMPFVWRVELRNYPGCLKPWIPEVLAFTKDPFWKQNGTYPYKGLFKGNNAWAPTFQTVSKDKKKEASIYRIPLKRKAPILPYLSFWAGATWERKIGIPLKERYYEGAFSTGSYLRLLQGLFKGLLAFFKVFPKGKL